MRVVLGESPDTAAVEPALHLSGSLDEVLDELGRRDVLQLLVEGGASVAHDFFEAGLVDRFVLYFAPALFGGDDGLSMFRGPGRKTIAELWRGRFDSFVPLGNDLRVDLVPADSPHPLSTGGS